MKRFLSLIALVAIVLSSCTNQPYAPSNSQVNVVVEQQSVGLDLQALGELAKTVTNGSDLEQKLNQAGSINNVDLNNDGNVDYLSVVEFGSGNNIGFSIADYLQNSYGGIDTNEIANITFSKNVQSNQVTTNINGNSSIYGTNSNYSNTQLLTDLLLVNYLFTPHSYYYSPYRAGYYPATYRSYREVPNGTYTNTVKKTYTTTTYKSTPKNTSTVSSPYANKVKSTYADEYKPKEIKSFSNATTSQKEFKVRDANKTVSDGSGFSNKKKESSGSSWFSSSSSSSSTNEAPKKSSYDAYKSSSSSNNSSTYGGGFKSGGSSSTYKSSGSSSSSSSTGGGFKSGGSGSSYKSSGSSYKSSGSSYKSTGGGFKSSSRKQ